MSYKHKKACTTLNYVKLFLILTSSITWYISISAFASLLGIPIRIARSTKIIGLKCSAITAGIKKYKSKIRNENKKYDQIEMLAKSKLNSIDLLDSYILID